MLSTKLMSKKVQVFKVCLSDYLPNFTLDKITKDFKIVGKLRFESLDDVLNRFKSDDFISYDKKNDKVTFDIVSLKSREMEKRLNYISKSIWAA